MKGQTALDIALVTYLNDYLYGSGDVNRFANNSTRKYVHQLTFVDQYGYLLASSPEEWFRLVKQDGTDNLRLWWRTRGEGDWQTDGFVGGGAEWFIEARRKGNSHIYSATWKYRPIGDEPEEEPWIVEYRLSQVIDLEPIDKLIDLEATKNEVREKLEEILRFLNTHDTTFPSSVFETGLQCLESVDPMNNEYAYHKDLVPSDFVSLKAL